MNKVKKNKNTGEGVGQRLKRDIRQNKYVYLMAVPVILFYICFCYLPMGGLLIAFQDYSPTKGIWGSKWVGFENFIDFFNDYQFPRLLRNTLTLSLELILFGFPAPILLALLITRETLSEGSSDSQLSAALHFTGGYLRPNQQLHSLYWCDKSGVVLFWI